MSEAVLKRRTIGESDQSPTSVGHSLSLHTTPRKRRSPRSSRSHHCRPRSLELAKPPRRGAKRLLFCDSRN
ncbi:hypothetical protein L596_012630 [Steinernema carpocapsae]|uniref:Uncharacterized protein n=1 Tax=Steinernema carpocapsae TaxID=34508 RepID=A0A4V6A4W6_STECR|nr:hypothetical protein L596_012630 [Steinernema carpocapsae]